MEIRESWFFHCFFMIVCFFEGRSEQISTCLGIQVSLNTQTQAWVEHCQTLPLSVSIPNLGPARHFFPITTIGFSAHAETHIQLDQMSLETP